MSIVVKNALALGVERLELPTPDGPGQARQNRQREDHGQGNQQVAEWATTSSELAAMPRPASQAGMRPATARGTAAAL